MGGKPEENTRDKEMIASRSIRKADSKTAARRWEAQGPSGRGELWAGDRDDFQRAQLPRAAGTKYHTGWLKTTEMNLSGFWRSESAAG